MITRSKAPLRLGLAGGGSDVSPYSDLYGGLILNATINLYAYCTITETSDGKITIEATDINQRQVFDTTPQLPIDGTVDLHKGVYNRIHARPSTWRVVVQNHQPTQTAIPGSDWAPPPRWW